MAAPVALTQGYTATSLDGYIADDSHSLDWLFTRDQDHAGPLSYAGFIAEVGALAMGASTYEWTLQHEFAARPAEKWVWPYEQPTWVFTHRALPLVPNAAIELTSGHVREVHARMLEAAGGKNLWIVGGGDLAGQFADVGLLDEVTVYIAPVTLGAGAPLFPRRQELKLQEVQRNRDFACARYGVVRS